MFALLIKILDKIEKNSNTNKAESKFENGERPNLSKSESTNLQQLCIGVVVGVKVEVSGVVYFWSAKVGVVKSSEARIFAALLKNCLIS